MTTPRMPTLFIPHGGGPCFFMDWTEGPADTWVPMGTWLSSLAKSLPSRPRSLVVISAHWEEPEVTIISGAAPSLLYDYYGFPEHTYKLEYPAPGAPVLAEKIAKLLVDHGISAKLDADRGFDHGVFIPLKLVFPDADIPIVQVSLKDSLDPAEHLKLGEAISSLRAEGVLIIGSGMSFHNLRTLLSNSQDGTRQSQLFDDWLHETLVAGDQNYEKRRQALSSWTQAPGARGAHPREEHLVPLMVVVGAAGNDVSTRIFNGKVSDTLISGYSFG